ncbi:MAG TPA: 2-hydroxyacid dehydrogenase [Candidatus Omnitrophota bacterium]|nr:2-hydroxyacid dehydrogenase [Candidatus Omnitrophota bacterium]HPB68334.1 2-hydroxyacid dehydrogenase [Candidatus Omnitrophota bacterium]HQO58003.1 2-hydroxyacid dehydrogenase [Candidatus Omnitrophota bacterium]
MNAKVLFFDTKPYDKEFFTRANEGYNFDIHYLKTHLTRETAEFAAGYPTVCAFVNDELDAATLDILHQQGVRLIALRCAGYNNVDLRSAFGRIHVVRVPGYSPYAVAEHAAALMLTLNRKTHKAYFRTRDGNFSINGLLGFDMHGKTAGVIGTGKIGKCLIHILRGIGMKILVYDVRPDESLKALEDVSYVDLPELYRRADVISLHCPLTAETQHMINEESISQMKDGVMIINTGRGKLIKTEALINGLKKGKIGAAGLDVYEEESEYFFEDFSMSMIGDDVLARLLTFPNVLITSHQGFFTREALTNIAETTLRNIDIFLKGGFIENEICYRCDGPCRRQKGQNCF